MGLIQAIKAAGKDVLGDAWREYFYCDSMDDDTLMVKGQKRISGKSSNRNGADNIISNGSIIAVNEGQCMLIVEQGKVVDVCAEPGEFVYDKSTEPTIFYGSLGTSILDTFKTVGKRFTFGGDTAKDQRVYYVNIKHVSGNKFGTPQPIPFKVCYPEIGINNMTVMLRCNGEYTFQIKNPLLFYQVEAGNVADEYNKADLVQNTLRPEFVRELRPVLGEFGVKGIGYEELTFHANEICESLQNRLSEKWTALRGIELVSLDLSATIPESDLAEIQKYQKLQYYNNTANAAGALVESQAEAMKNAANNPGGAMMGFMGLNMAQQSGGANAQNLFAMAQQQQQQPAQPAAFSAAGTQPASADSWTCQCGATNTGKFCTECGTPKPADGWTCSCGAVNKGKFCMECGAKKPEGAPLYRCDKCGWEPEDPMNPPKFCPECGDPFNDADRTN
ncbi:MAG: SPFH domain-containing protein [Lachnospiraceae bacterium]|nr:SPFH domain-containing protein [Lachnospiraceae bacterium]